MENALPDESRMIFDPLAPVMNVEAPAIVKSPLSDMSPVVAVALSAPPTVDAAKVNPASLTTVALPDPLVVS